MTLNNFEELCGKVFAERLIAVRDAEDGEQLLQAICSELERVALSSGLEVCERGAYLLVFARYDMHLDEHRVELGVPDDYFEGDRPTEQEAFTYLHERRCGALARHLH
ncbi:MAG: hypothetical protein JWO71_1714 [Candidatus Acidoferrum typicum]|nr:hypothetical protein [Candidatus Acidoferrum typicum]